MITPFVVGGKEFKFDCQRVNRAGQTVYTYLSDKYVVHFIQLGDNRYYMRVNEVCSGELDLIYGPSSLPILKLDLKRAMGHFI